MEYPTSINQSICLYLHDTNLYNFKNKSCSDRLFYNQLKHQNWSRTCPNVKPNNENKNFT